MELKRSQKPLLLLAGDIFFWLASLWGALFLRYFKVPSYDLLHIHLVPFLIIFFIWIFVFFIFDLYKQQTVFVRNRLLKNILNAQILNSIIALIFFYFIPYFGITPKTILFIYLFLSLVLILFWRLYFVNFLYKGEDVNLLFIGYGDVESQIIKELKNNKYYGVRLFNINSFDIDEITKYVSGHDIKVIVFDMHKEKITKHPDLYKLLFLHVQFIDTRDIYEDIFDRIPIDLLYDNWFIENISNHPKKFYEISKRIIDIAISFILGTASLLLYPFIIFAIKADDGGPVFITQKRVGKDNSLIKLYKFRTMDFNDEGIYKKTNLNKVTKVGKFLRKTRLDELPQLWNVLKGDISLIGPRPELPELAKEYSEKIPYYNTRNLIKPGLSGWAQIYHENHPHHGTNIEETKNKLSYDLFYIKNRDVILDIKIILKTIRILLSRTGV